LILNKFNWAEYNILANELSKISTLEDVNTELITTQAGLRCAISRSYYSAFCEARSYLDNIEGKTAPEQKSVHQFVINQFIYEHDAIKQKIGKDLQQLLLERKKVDYEDQLFFHNPKKAQLCVKLADFIMNNLRELQNK
jgi:uncharacterized protein (UPF0332 family)